MTQPETPKVETEKSTRPNLGFGWLGYLACAFAILVILFCVAAFFPPFRDFFCTPSETKLSAEYTLTDSKFSADSGKPLWSTIAPQLVLGALGFLGGAVGLWQWNRTYAQKQEEIWIKEAEVANKEQQDRFVDIQDRFASTDTTIRANAALRLAEFARTPLPRTRTEQEDARKKNERFLVNVLNNPYFPPAASQLATALYIEPNPAVRESVVEALGNMAGWDKLPDDLRAELIHRIANANRAAKDNFITAFAAWSVDSAEWQAWERFQTAKGAMAKDAAKAKEDAQSKAFSLPVALTLFCNSPKSTTDCLKTLMAEMAAGSNEAKFNVAQAVHRAKQKAMGDTERKRDAALRLPTLETAARTLTDTRNALAYALHTLKLPSDFPNNRVDSVQVEIEKAQRVLSSFTSEKELTDALNQIESAVQRIQSGVSPEVASMGKPKPSLDLSTTFLAGADLKQTNLAGAKLKQTNLVGAKLEQATLTSADLYQATLTGSNLNQATLTGSNLNQATLTEAKLSRAILTGSNLNQANLTDADLNWATLTGADLNQATLTEAKLEQATLTGADLYQATLTEAKLNQATLTGSNLNQATLTKAKLSRAILTKANLNQANLTDADLNWATLTRADLNRAILTGAMVIGSTLDMAAVIPPTWEQADYKSSLSNEDVEFRKRVEEAYLRQPESIRQEMEEYEASRGARAAGSE